MTPSGNAAAAYSRGPRVEARARLAWEPDARLRIGDRRARIPFSRGSNP